MGQITQEKMTCWDICLEFAFFSVLYGLLIVALHLRYGAQLNIDSIPYWILATV
jgi:hypothetical protein